MGEEKAREVCKSDFQCDVISKRSLGSPREVYEEKLATALGDRKRAVYYSNLGYGLKLSE